MISDPDVAADPKLTVFDGENYVMDQEVTTLTCTIDMLLSENATIEMTCPDIEQQSSEVTSGSVPRGQPQKCSCLVIEPDCYISTSYVNLVSACRSQSLTLLFTIIWNKLGMADSAPK